MRTRFYLCHCILAGAASIVSASKAHPAEDGAARARAVVERHEREIRPLEKAVALAWWEANTTGKDEAFARKEEAQNRLDAALAEKPRFRELEEAAAALGPGGPADATLVRQIVVLRLQYLEKQVDPEILRKMTAKSNAVEKTFNVYRARVNGAEMTDSQVRKVLKESKDPAERKAVWEGQKGVAPLVEGDLRELVKLRNEAARQLGFKDYHVLMLHLSEQKQEDVLRVFDELEALTREPFRAAKAEIDASLAATYGVTPADLRPWHYHDPFFQEAPAIYKESFDTVYKDVDILKLCREFYAGIGLPIDRVLEKSDLYERAGKSPHAFCTDMDREGDVRVLANIVPNEYWMGTMLHELGHAVYSSLNISPRVPYVLRGESHILTTEGMAMLFEKFSKSATWLERMGQRVPEAKPLEDTGRRMRRNQLLIFAAWCQVMFRFEAAMYADPDRDLGDLWWGLVERYQMLRRPEGRKAPDYASKIHVVSAPAYYHNYLLGQLFASQLHHAICREVLHAEPAGALYNGNKEVGRFLDERVFDPGRTLSWNDLTKHATGEALSPRAFAADLKSVPAGAR
jgi:peptidyl-dipeptidase A